MTLSLTLKLRMLTSLLMTVPLTAMMSGWVTCLNLGLSSDFMGYWGSAFIKAWPAAYLTVLAIGPGVARLAQRLLAPPA